MGSVRAPRRKAAEVSPKLAWGAGHSAVNIWLIGTKADEAGKHPMAPRALGTLLGLLLATVACSKQAETTAAKSTPAPMLASLAALPELPQESSTTAGLRAASASNNYNTGSGAWQTSPSGTTSNGVFLELDSAGGIAWALYQWSGLTLQDQLLQLL